MFVTSFIIGTFFTGSVALLFYGIKKASAIVIRNGPPKWAANDEERRQRLERLDERIRRMDFSCPPRGLPYYYDSKHNRHYWNT